jgi:hypothetical protein
MVNDTIANVKMASVGKANVEMASAKMAGSRTVNTAQAAQHAARQQQLGFPGGVTHHSPASAPSRHAPHDASRRPLCAGCREKEARYGFRRDEDDPAMERPRTLCFECFRVELAYRHDVSARLARGWNASQVALPLDEKLNELTRRRRRAQITARRALGL